MRTNKFLLTVVSVLVIIMTITSCAPQATSTAAPATQPSEATQPPAAGPTATPPPTATLPPAAKFSEAPELAQMVKDGKLPPVEKRLPESPVVTKPVDSVGKYGGTLHTASWWPEVGNVQLYFAVEAPIKWKADLSGYEAALVESYEWSADGKTFTLHMRKGLKWSDGEPYTSADWKYWWEDYATVPEQKLYTPGAYLRNADGTLINMSFPDDFTVVWQAKDRPLWVDPYFMAQGYWEWAKNFMKPAHYLSQFNPKLHPDLKWEDYAKKEQYWLNKDMPCLFAWCLSDLSADGSQYTFSRNPYYWRVDTAGNQLPYIDKIAVEIVADDQTRILNCSQGKYDTAFRICGGPNDIPLLNEQAKAGGYHQLKGWMNGAGAWPGYMVNQYYVEGGKNYTDDTPEHAKEIRDLLRNTSFRKALSTGFDRQRIIDVAWNGIGEAKQATISPQSWHFASPEGQKVYKQWAATDIKFDAAAANKSLDDIGMKVGADGFRTLPSGKAFEMVVDVTDWGGSLKVQTDVAAEMKVQWETNLKIKVKVNNIQGQPDVDTRTNEGYYMIRAAHVSEIDILTYPDWLFPVVNRYMFPLEGRYFANGKDACKPDPAAHLSCGVKPEAGSPAEILQGLYVKAMNEPDINKRHAIVWDAIAEIEKDGPFVIGISGDQAMPIFAKDYMKNILDFGVVGPWAPATPGNQIVAQWWMDK